MTAITEEYEETVKRSRVLRNICDKCGETLPLELGYDTRDFELEFTTGTNYPECGSQEGWKVADLCDSCVDWLKATLQENGVQITEVERDW